MTPQSYKILNNNSVRFCWPVHFQLPERKCEIGIELSMVGRMHTQARLSAENRM